MNSEGVRKACSHFFCLRISGEDDNERGRGFFFRCVMEESAIQDLDNWE